MAELAAFVHVLDKAGAHHVFGPGDDVPDWAAELITNPAAWLGGPPEPSDKGLPEGDPNSSWTNDQLRQFAEDNKIDLGDAKKKAEIVAAIEAKLKAGELPEGDPDDTWTLEELTRFAADRSIDLGDATGEDDILAAIVLAVEAEGEQGA